MRRPAIVLAMRWQHSEAATLFSQFSTLTEDRATNIVILALVAIPKNLKNLGRSLESDDRLESKISIPLAGEVNEVGRRAKDAP